MSLVTAINLSLSFGRKQILDDVSFAVQPGERIGLIGPNGAGKSSLMRLLAGERTPDEGEITFARGVRAGYLPQDILELPAGTLVESVRSTVGDRDRLVVALAAVEQELAALTADSQSQATAEDDDALAPQMELTQRLVDLHAELADFDERYGRHRAESILSGLGFAQSDFDRNVNELSGGWKMRAALAGLLLLDPELLLLDEPTNHLDIPSLAWFDGFLRRSHKALILISHDRDFLNRQIKRVLTFEPEGLRTYPGDYESYRRQRAEEEENLELRAKRQAAQRAETQRFVDRFRYKASKARQVQSRVKLLAKEEIVTVREQHATVQFRFPEVARSGREVVRLEGVSKRFGERIIYRDLTQTIARGERVAIIGRNGAGKTTLLKIIAGELPIDGGSFTLGHNVTPAYYAQHHTEKLDGDKTVLAEVASLVPREPPSFVRRILGAFLFDNDDVEKKISVLSGGERARVALARLLVIPSNLLILDEPTNHLDLDSSERLIEALKGYGGTLLFVSHNRSFINQLATQIWDVADGRIESWPGNLDAYLYHLEQIGRPLGGSEPVVVERARPAVESDKDRRQREAQARQQRGARTRPLEKEIARIESEVAALEREQQGLAQQMSASSFYDDFTRAQPVLDRHRVVSETLELLYAKWSEQQEALAKITATDS